MTAVLEFPLKYGLRIRVSLLSRNTIKFSFDSLSFLLESLEITLVRASSDLLINLPYLKSSLSPRDSDPARSARVIVGKRNLVEKSLLRISISIENITWDLLDLWFH